MQVLSFNTSGYTILSGNPVVYFEYLLVPGSEQIYLNILALHVDGTETVDVEESIPITIYTGAPVNGVYPAQVQFDDILRAWSRPLKFYTASIIRGGRTFCITKEPVTQISGSSTLRIFRFFPGKIPDLEWRAMDVGTGERHPVQMMLDGNYPGILTARRPQNGIVHFTWQELYAMEQFFFVKQDEYPEIYTTEPVEFSDFCGIRYPAIYDMWDADGFPGTLRLPCEHVGISELVIIDDLEEKVCLLRWQNRYGVSEALALPCAGNMEENIEWEEASEYIVRDRGMRLKKRQTQGMTRAFSLNNISVLTVWREALLDMLRSDTQEVQIDGEWYDCIVTADPVFSLRQHTADTVSLKISLTQTEK